MVIVLLIEVTKDDMDRDMKLIGFSIILEEIIRYVINYLIINTFSR
jgi:hypothetical protein